MAGRHPHGAHGCRLPCLAPCCSRFATAAAGAHPPTADLARMHPPTSVACLLDALPQVVHRLGRHFGFQAFNLDPRSEVRPPPAALPLLPPRRWRAPAAAAAARPCLPNARRMPAARSPSVPAPACQSKEPVYVPATIFLVTDHLYHLLVKNYMRRDKAAGALLGAGRRRGRAGAGRAPAGRRGRGWVGAGHWGRCSRQATRQRLQACAAAGCR